jgi:hypothetical protein
LALIIGEVTVISGAAALITSELALIIGALALISLVLYLHIPGLTRQPAHRPPCHTLAKHRHPRPATGARAPVLDIPPMALRRAASLGMRC